MEGFRSGLCTMWTAAGASWPQLPWRLPTLHTAPKDVATGLVDAGCVVDGGWALPLDLAF